MDSTTVLGGLKEKKMCTHNWDGWRVGGGIVEVEYDRSSISGQCSYLCTSALKSAGVCLRDELNFLLS